MQLLTFKKIIQVLNKTILDYNIKIDLIFYIANKLDSYIYLFLS